MRSFCLKYCSHRGRSRKPQPICRKADCSPFDIGTEKFRFTESVWRPDLLFELKMIVKTAIVRGQNNIPLRRKRDDNADDSKLPSPSGVLYRQWYCKTLRNISRMRQGMSLTTPKRYRTRLSRLWGITFLQRSSRKLSKPEYFLLRLTRQRTFPTKKTCLLSSAKPTLQRIFERSLLITSFVEKKQPVTQSSSK